MISVALVLCAMGALVLALAIPFGFGWCLCSLRHRVDHEARLVVTIGHQRVASWLVTDIARAAATWPHYDRDLEAFAGRLITEPRPIPYKITITKAEA